MAALNKPMTKKQDMAMDKKLTKSLTPAQKAKFKREDMKMDRNKKLTAKQDMKLDRKLISKIKKTTRGR